MEFALSTATGRLRTGNCVFCVCLCRCVCVRLRHCLWHFVQIGQWDTPLRCDMGTDLNGCWMGNWCQDKSMGGCPAPIGGEEILKSYQEVYQAEGEQILKILSWKLWRSLIGQLWNMQDPSLTLVRTSAPTWPTLRYQCNCQRRRQSASTLCNDKVVITIGN